MLILRQKIFFNYSGYTPEQIEQIKTERSQQAKKLMDQRRAAQQKMQTANESSKQETSRRIREINDLKLGKRNTDLAHQSVIAQYQSNANKNLQVRNKAYDEALKENAKFKQALEKKYKRTLPTSTTTSYTKTNNNIQRSPIQPQQSQQKQGMGLGGKLAIGTAAVAGTALTARYIQKRKERKRNELESNQQQNNNKL